MSGICFVPGVGEAMVTLLKPVATVKKKDDGWHRVAWMAGNQGVVDVESIYPNKEEAVKAAQTFAEKFHFIYIDPDDGKFISVFFHKASQRFIPVEVPTEGKVVGTGHEHEDPKNAVMEAEQIAKSKELPFEPNFFTLTDPSKLGVFSSPLASDQNEKPE